MNPTPRIRAALSYTILVLVLAVPAVVRAEPGLDTVVRAVSHDVITAIRHERGAHAGEPAKRVDLGERLILPHVDTECMTRLAIDYSLAKTASGWRVYDIRIGGASLATAYGPAFSEEARNYGIEGLISLLSIRNQERARRAPPVLSVRASAQCASVKT